MTLQRFEVGLVSGDRTLVEFLAEVFQLEQLPASEHGVGTLHRLQAPGAVIKIMVPNQPPASGDGQPFIAVKGLRYLSMFVTDLDAVVERCLARGGSIVVEPFELELGRLAMIQDPDGNTMEVLETASTSEAEEEGDR